MKRLDLIRMIATAAHESDLRWKLLRQGSDHEVWDLDGLRVMVPRHREVNERTAGKIMKLLEDRLGPGWWQG